MSEHHVLKSQKTYGAVEDAENGGYGNKDNWEDHHRDDEQIGDMEKSDHRTRNNTYIEETHGAYGASMASVKHYLGNSLSNFRAASLSISMLAKPSDDRKASALLAGWNVSNLIQGTGILGVPYAVQQGGWAAVFMIFFIALLCCYTGKLLIECMYETSKKTNIRRRLRVNYPEVAEACFGRRGLILIGIIQSIEMYSAVILYVILLGTAWADLLKVYKQYLGLKEWSAINCVVVLPSLFITKMSIISWFSMISVFSLMSSLFTLIAFTLTQTHTWTLAHIPPFNPTTFPVGFGIIVFSYCAHAVFPSIEGSMKKPSQFPTMMNFSFALAATIKGMLGLFLVLCFGMTTNQVATVNVAKHVGFSRVATSLVIANVMLAIPLAMFIVSATLDDALLGYFPRVNRDSDHHWVWLLISRPLLLGFGLCIGVLVPYFGLIMGVVGSFTGSSLCFIFPCLFHLILRKNSISKLQYAINVFVICFGILAGGCGVVFSLKALITAMKNGHV